MSCARIHPGALVLADLEHVHVDEELVDDLAVVRAVAVEAVDQHEAHRSR